MFLLLGLSPQRIRLLNLQPPQRAAHRVDGEARIRCTIQTFAGVALDVAQGELVTRTIEQPPLTSTICIGMPREAQASWLTREVARPLRGCVARLVGDNVWPGARMVDDGQGR